MYFTFLLFSLLFFLSPFTCLGFYTVDYIYSCTLHCSIASHNQILFPHHFAPRSHLCFIPFDLHTSAQHSQPSPITSLLLRTRLATFMHSYTCDRHCLFHFGHGQRCVSTSAGSIDILIGGYILLQENPDITGRKLGEERNQSCCHVMCAVAKPAAHDHRTFSPHFPIHKCTRTFGFSNIAQQPIKDEYR
jgi:hypothetical protein